MIFGCSYRPVNLDISKIRSTQCNRPWLPIFVFTFIIAVIVRTHTTCNSLPFTSIEPKWFLPNYLALVFISHYFIFIHIPNWIFWSSKFSNPKMRLISNCPCLSLSDQDKLILLWYSWPLGISPNAPYSPWILLDQPHHSLQSWKFLHNFQSFAHRTTAACKTIRCRSITKTGLMFWASNFMFSASHR